MASAIPRLERAVYIFAGLLVGLTLVLLLWGMTSLSVPARAGVTAAAATGLAMGAIGIVRWVRR